jgi:hypothetical protein
MHQVHISLFSIMTLLICFATSIEGVIGTTTAITTPTDNAIISGASILFAGTSSEANSTMLLIINTTTVAIITTDTDGDWSFTYPDELPNGAYTFTVNVIDSSFSTLATDSISFDVVNLHKITITDPAQDAVVSALLPALIQGTSSVASGFVQLYMNTLFTNTVSTDINGNWQSNYPALSNGEHTLFAELLTENPLEVVADTTTTFTSSHPITFPPGVSIIWLVQGRITTSGSGSGPGFTYTVSGSTITITFSPAFPLIPYVIATGHHSSLPSTITISAVSKTSASILFSDGTEEVSFQASLLQ